VIETKVVEKIKIHILHSVPFLTKIAPFIRKIMWKNMVDSDRPQMVMRYGACALHAGYLRLQTQTQNM